MCRFTIAAALTMMVATSAQAGVISPGTWSPTPTPTLEANGSEDCATCAGIWTLPRDTLMMTAGFGYEGWLGAVSLGGITDYHPAPGLTYDGLSFTYNNGQGSAYTAWDGYHFRLYTLADQYGAWFWIHVEDLPDPIVPDWNDARFRWREGELPPELPPNIPPTSPSIPEPGIAILLAVAFAARYRRRG